MSLVVVILLCVAIMVLGFSGGKPGVVAGCLALLALLVQLGLYFHLGR